MGVFGVDDVAFLLVDGPLLAKQAVSSDVHLTLCLVVVVVEVLSLDLLERIEKLLGVYGSVVGRFALSLQGVQPVLDPL